ncbi:MAG: hypothetical protein EBT79_02270 [Actinobacteria bacterium]|nr:hypothetical protein [Actinomycetota bacterium]
MAVQSLARSIPGDWTSPRVRTGEVTHAGRVLSIYTTIEQVMSDVWEYMTYATVWDDAEGRPTKVFLRGEGCEAEAEAEVDATPEVVAAHDAWLAARVAEKVAAAEARLEEQAEARLREVQRGCRAVVARGRKVAKGTEGRVFWLGRGTYGWRAGLETDDGQTVWTALSNLDRVLPPKPEGMGWRDFSAHLAELRA